MALLLYLAAILYDNTIKLRTIGSAKYLFFYLKVQSPFRLIMENNFIQMAVSAGHAVPTCYMIDPIFKHIITVVQLYFTNCFTNIILYRVNYLWLISVTLIFDLHDRCNF